VLIAVTASALTYRYTTHPNRVAEAFLRACREGDIPRLYGLMDRAFQQAIPAPTGCALLTALNSAIPRDGSIALSGYPSADNPVSDRHRYHVRVEASGAGPDSRRAGTFLIVLTQGKDGRWRVAFLPTYENLYFAQPPGAPVPDMNRWVAWAAGLRASRLQQWREWD
jgi:hypothetical protein